MMQAQPTSNSLIEESVLIEVASKRLCVELGFRSDAFINALGYSLLASQIKIRIWERPFRSCGEVV